jgi:hypothetical protein
MGINFKIDPPRTGSVIVQWEGDLPAQELSQVVEQLTRDTGSLPDTKLVIVAAPMPRGPAPAEPTCPRCLSSIPAKASRCRFCQADIGEKSQWGMTREFLNAFMRHPIVLVLIATLLSIPQVTKWIARNQATEEARTRKGLDAVAAAFQVERDLNVVTTLLYAFGRDFGVPRRTPDAYASAQHDLRQSLIQLWGSVDRDAWWWHGQVGLETSLLRVLNEPQRRAFEALAAGYKNDLLLSTTQVDRLWTHFLRRRQPAAAETETLMRDTDACLRKLTEHRLHIATRIASFFDRPESTDAKQLAESLKFPGFPACEQKPIELASLNP